MKTILRTVIAASFFAGFALLPIAAQDPPPEKVKAESKAPIKKALEGLPDETVEKARTRFFEDNEGPDLVSPKPTYGDWYSLVFDSDRDSDLGVKPPMLNDDLRILGDKAREEGERLATDDITLSADISARSSTEMQLFAVSRFRESYELNFGTSIVSLTTQELATLREGKALPEDHALSKIVQQSSNRPLVVSTKPLVSPKAEQLEASDDVAFSLSKAYPSVQIVRDPFSDKTPGLVRKLQQLGTSTGAKTVAVVAEDSFEVQDYKIVQNLEEELQEKGISVVEVSKENIQEANIVGTKSGGNLVLVITGHIDAQLARFVRALGQAGFFHDNWVVFNSCRAKLSRQLATEMTTEYGANAVHVWDKVLRPEELEPLLLEIPASIERNSELPFVKAFREIIQRHQLNGIWTVSQNFFPIASEAA